MATDRTHLPPIDQAARDWATDPSHHVVLEASAGTGKTRVLVDRYLALLAAGVDPAHVLAITFTRKAAAEMRDRMVTDLRARHPAIWQRLRDRAQDISVSTIDAFCFALLREFPLEAGLDPGFELADETEIARLIEMALDASLRECRARAAHDDALRLVFAQLSIGRLATGLRSLLERRYVAPAALRLYLRRHIRQERSEATVVASVRACLRRGLDAMPGDVAAWLASGPPDHPAFALCRADLDRLVSDDPMPPADVRASMDGLARWVLTKTGDVRKQPAATRSAFATPADYARHKQFLPAIGQVVHAATDRFAQGLNVLLARGIHRIFRTTLRRYLETLVLHDALDFSEVLARAVSLLARMDEFSRSRFRLESRYQHVLVDEFQDTSRLQWELVALLIRSWGEGAGVGEDAPVPPSIFLVGDKKQSIYRFRDAEVSLLDEAAGYIGTLGPPADVRRAISQSFRAVPGLLAFTNDVAAGMVAPDAPPGVAFRYDASDRFPLPPAGDEAPDDPTLGLVVADDVEACARGVAREVVRLLDGVQVMDRETGHPRTMRPGDVAILFRSRESHREFEHALAEQHVPSYVYKGLGFYDADEIKDLVALVRYLAAPESDLRAAALLRSRLVGLSDEGLRQLAPELAAALRVDTAPEALPAEDLEALTRMRVTLGRWLPEVDRVPPATLVDQVIEETAFAFEWRGPRARQARENVKKFRALLRRIQNRGYATMGRIAAHIDRLSAGDESNAALDAVDAVNLMTVHASKGLEFPVVFVVNVTRATGGLPPAMRVVSDEARDEPLVAVATYDPDTARVEAAQEREETKRLAYVALTRARERLYLSASRARPGASRKGSLADVLPQDLVEVIMQATDAGGQMLRWEATSGSHVFRNCAVPPSSTDDGVPAAAVELAAELPPSLRPLPSGGPVAGSVTAVALGRADGQHADAWLHGSDEELIVGRLVHRLLARARADGSDDALAALGRQLLDPEEQAEAGAEVVQQAVRLYRAVMADTELRAWLQAPEARFEVPVSLRLPGAPGAPIVRGTIDCLVPVDGVLMIVEFKTGQRRAWHQRQLALYRDAVSRVWPGRRVEARLVYAVSGPARDPDTLRLPFEAPSPADV